MIEMAFIWMKIDLNSQHFDVDVIVAGYLRFAFSIKLCRNL